jgi:ATP-dependent RNA helicase RhlE
MPFTKLGLSAPLLRAIAEQGYIHPTPIQEQAIPVVLEGRDLMAGAQTGTGKTAGFVLPLLQRLSIHASTSTSPAKHPVRALILTPTRELAVQVEESVRAYGKHLALKSTVVYGGVNITTQIKAMQSGVDILVATPGRLLDHVQQRTVNLGKVEILVMDEADRMLDMGFILDIRKILALMPAQRQSLMFSATFSEEIKRLADQILKNPALIEVAGRNAAAESVTQVVYQVDQANKRALLGHLVKSNGWRQVLVFTRTKNSADRLCKELVRDGINAAAIHGDKSQPQRTQALEEFKQGAVQVLVATDIAARGLDIDQLPHVVNYELPHVPEDYVHRIGRTGRAGASGEAISLVSPDEARYLADIERLLKRQIPSQLIPGFEPGRAPAHAAPRDGRRPERAPYGQRPRQEERRPQREPDAAPAATQDGDPETVPQAAPSAPATAMLPPSPARPPANSNRPVPALFLPPASDRSS